MLLTPTPRLPRLLLLPPLLVNRDGGGGGGTLAAEVPPPLLLLPPPNAAVMRAARAWRFSRARRICSRKSPIIYSFHSFPQLALLWLAHCAAVYFLVRSTAGHTMGHLLT